MVQVTNMPSPRQVEEEYDENFFQKYYKDLERNNRKQRYTYLNSNNKLDQIEKRTRKKGKILDVGCSFGFFLDAARQRGWSVAGLEVSKHAGEYARNRLGLWVENRTITEAKFEKKHFDVITLWYVVEHLPNPKEVLMYLTSFLKDKGMLVVGTPNVNSFRARIHRKKWFIPPVHVLYFSPKTIGNLFKKCKLELIDQELAFPYEKYLRKYRLFNLLNKIKLGDNVIYYAKKAESEM